MRTFLTNNGEVMCLEITWSKSLLLFINQYMWHVLENPVSPLAGYLPIVGISLQKNVQVQDSVFSIKSYIYIIYVNNGPKRKNATTTHFFVTVLYMQ